MSPSPNWTVYLLLLPPLLAGALLLRIGRKQRIGADPHCRPCNYPLQGIDSQRCPECGVLLSSRTIVYGQPQRRWKIFLAGWGVILVVSLIGAAGVLSRVDHVDWYHYKPTYLVLQNLNSGVPAQQQRAWFEMQRRGQTESFSSSASEQLVAYALSSQGNARAPYSLHDAAVLKYLTSRLQAGTLSAEQEKRFYAQSVLLAQFTIRPRIIAGDDVPCNLECEGLGPYGTFWRRLSLHEVDIDGQKYQNPQPRPISMSGNENRFDFSWRLKCPPPGKHDLVCSARVEVYSGWHEQPGSPLLYSEDRNFSTSFEVLQTEPPGLIQRIVDPKLAGAMRAAIAVRGATFNTTNNLMDLIVGRDDLPANAAFDIFVRYGGAEHLLRGVTAKAGSPIQQFNMGPLAPPPPDTVDIIFRPSEQNAKSTVDFYSFWDQEIVFENVHVTKK